MKTSLTLLLAITAGAARAAAFEAADGPRPLIAVWQLEADQTGLSLDGAPEAPRSIIYENGTTIRMVLPSRAEPELYRRAREQPFFAAGRLSPAELGSWYEDVLAVATNPGLQSHYELSSSREKPSVLLYFFAGGAAINVTIHGLDETSLDRFGAARDGTSAYVPARLLRLYQHLTQSSDPRAKEWQPHWFEVELRPTPESAPAAEVLPPAWQRAIAQNGRETDDEMVFYLPGTERSDVEQRFAPGTELKVRFRDKMMLASYRPVFPGENAWRSSWREAVERAIRARESVPEHRDQLARERESLREEFRRKRSEISMPK